MAGSAVGIQSVLGVAAESTFGTAVTVTRFLEFNSETITRKNNVIQSNGLRGGTRNLRRGSRRVLASHDAAGDIVLEVPTTGMGLLFDQIMGGTATVTGTGPYTQTFAMGSVLGKSLTIQKQLRDPSQANITTLTYSGVKILDAEFSIAVNKILELKLTVDARDESKAIVAASPSYSATSLYNFSQATITVAGANPVNVLDAMIKVSNKADTARYFLGNQGLKSEPMDSDFPEVTGQLTAEVVDEVAFNLFTADTAASFSMVFTNGAATLTFTIPEIHYTGASPRVAGFGVVKNQLPFIAAYNGTNPGMTITTVNTDAAI